jgi:hypothetical protein
MRCQCNGLLYIVFTGMKATVYACRRCTKQYAWTEIEGRVNGPEARVAEVGVEGTADRRGNMDDEVSRPSRGLRGEGDQLY